jgi:hypothetical protein
VRIIGNSYLSSLPRNQSMIDLPKSEGCMGCARTGATWKRLIPASASTIGAAALPKCPLCATALLASFGVSLPVTVSSVILVAGCAGLLCVSVVLLCVSSSAGKRTGPLLLAVSGGFLMAGARLLGLATVLSAVGVTAVLTALLWRAWPRGGVSCHREGLADK